MSGLKMKYKEILKATSSAPELGDFEWDEKNEDDRPLSKDEMLKGMVNKGGRPKSLNPKVSATIRYNPEILNYFKATGKGWQTRINDVLAEYVRSH